MSSWKTLMHKNAIKIVWGVKSVVLLPKIQALFGEKNLGAFFGAFWLNWGASWFKHFSHPAPQSSKRHHRHFVSEKNYVKSEESCRKLQLQRIWWKPWLQTIPLWKTKPGIFTLTLIVFKHMASTWPIWRNWNPLESAPLEA